ncbi:MAG: camphor resistance protein CrcB [Acidobacteriales bacterium]|nr:camphor resistance protein CrcB [Terriglobales bacterium]
MYFVRLLKVGDGVRHNRLFFGLMTPTIFSWENSIVRDYIWISIGALAGANLRYAVSRFTARFLSADFPYATLAINVTGSLMVGFFLIRTTERVFVDPRWRLFVAIGFCGSYTTFSSYAFETFAYFEQGHWALMAANILSNNLLCLLAVLAGAAIARAV